MLIVIIITNDNRANTTFTLRRVKLSRVSANRRVRRSEQMLPVELRRSLCSMLQLSNVG